MGNYSFKPKRTFSQNQPVYIKGFDFTHEHVPGELQKFGKGAYVTDQSSMYQSRPDAPKIYVTKVKFPNGKEELFLANDLCTVEEAKNIKDPTKTSRSGPINTGSRIINSKYR